jgi:hypothetical protein
LPSGASYQSTDDASDNRSNPGEECRSNRSSSSGECPPANCAANRSIAMAGAGRGYVVRIKRKTGND